jgi:MutS-like protein
MKLKSLRWERVARYSQIYQATGHNGVLFEIKPYGRALALYVGGVFKERGETVGFLKMAAKAVNDELQHENKTPLQSAWEALKVIAVNKSLNKNKPTLLAVRIGDFYEFFAEDALTVSPLLELAKTKRGDVIMCGVPYHSIYTAGQKLNKLGYEVFIAEKVDRFGPLEMVNWTVTSI